MAAPAFTSSFDSLSIGSFIGFRTHSDRVTHHSPDRSNINKPRDRTLSDHTNMADLGLLWSRLLELLPQGVVVVSRSLKPVYWNQKALRLSQALAIGDFSETVPFTIAEACQRLLRENSTSGQSLILEYQTVEGHLMRISARRLELATDETAVLSPTRLRSDSSHEAAKAPAFIAVFLENCDEVMQQEMRIQQKKYDLTEREAEIWMLLRQEYTYQEIALNLQISLNTVKTHVKNIYAKRRSCLEKEKFWYQG